jgi:pSer/pThr/pTyr-binding forkhead associated (FHA) protein
MSDNRQPGLIDPTIRREATASFRRHQLPSRWVGVLVPIAGLSTAVIRLEQGELIVGRDEDCGAVLSDEGVSRRHAHLTRKGDAFVLEDLDSFNGTHVDGVPILSCVLHDGDTVQLGQNLYSFELELRLPAAASAREGQQ